MTRVELTLPEMGLGDQPLTLSAWHAETGASVYEGDRLVEITAGDVTVDLPSPATGTLAEQLAAEDDAVIVGQLLGVIQVNES